jgi:coenzyme PQQ precursor peptide PqqA
MESSAVKPRTEVWEAPEFEEIGVAPEVTMYVARLDD